MNIWVVIYEHRYGVDAWPISSVEEPDVDEVIKGLKESEYTDFEPERGETIEIRGPWELNKESKKES